MARLAATVLLPTPPLPLLTAMMFFTPGSICPTSGRGLLLNSVIISTSMLSSFWQWYLMAASAAFTVDFKNGSVSRGNSSTTFTFQLSPSFCGAAILGVSATIPLSTRFFFVPAYVTVASASIINWGYSVIFSIFCAQRYELASKMQKESLLFFSFSSESTFGVAKVRISARKTK